MGAQPSVAVQERQAEPVVNLSGALSTSSVLASTDEDDLSLEARQCVQALREGKRCAVPALTICVVHRGSESRCLALSPCLLSPALGTASMDTFLNDLVLHAGT